MGELDRVLNRLDKIGETTTRTEEQVKGLSKSFDEIKEKTEEQDVRIQLLDTFKTRITAYIVVLVFIFGAVIKLM
jgi:archaellum component FlaC